MYEINQTDTDILYMSLARNSVEELVPSEKREAFKANKHLWFVTPKEHLDCSKLNILVLKWYICVLRATDNGTVKLSP